MGVYFEPVLSLCADFCEVITHTVRSSTSTAAVSQVITTERPNVVGIVIKNVGTKTIRLKFTATTPSAANTLTGTGTFAITAGDTLALKWKGYRKLTDDGTNYTTGIYAKSATAATTLQVWRFYNH